MPSAAAAPLDVSLAQREVLESVARSRTAAHREVLRAKVLLDAADGVANVAIAGRHGVTAGTVRSWRKAFEANGLTGWGTVAKGRGRKPTIDDEKIAEIVELTTMTRPKGQTHWSTRTMAEHVGVSKDTVRRIWNGLGLQPHRVETFKVQGSAGVVAGADEVGADAAVAAQGGQGWPAAGDLLGEFEPADRGF